MLKFIFCFIVIGCSLPAVSSAAGDMNQIKGFLHEGTCEPDKLPEDRIGRSSGAISGDFETDDFERRTFSIEIQIFADGTYWAHYQEFILPSELGGGEWSEEHLKRIIEGKWSVADDRLELTGLGEGFFKLDSSELVKLRFTLQAKLVSSSAVGVSADLHSYHTYMGPKRACDMRNVQK